MFNSKSGVNDDFLYLNICVIFYSSIKIYFTAWIAVLILMLSYNQSHFICIALFIEYAVQSALHH